jgi:hypothetical protein
MFESEECDEKSSSISRASPADALDFDVDWCGDVGIGIYEGFERLSRFGDGVEVAAAADAQAGSVSRGEM